MNKTPSLFRKEVAFEADGVCELSAIHKKAMNFETKEPLLSRQVPSLKQLELSCWSSIEVDCLLVRRCSGSNHAEMNALLNLQ